MLSSINIHSPVSVYEQIENQIRFAIASENIAEGEQLPSIKELGQRLGINFNTVAKAYRDLEVMELIYTRRGMGCFINKGVVAKCRETCRIQINKRIHEVVQEAKAAGISKKDVTAVVSKSYASNAELYGDVPAEILAMAKKRK